MIQLLAERLDLPQILKLDSEGQAKKWTTYDICEAWALKKGFVTARSNRPDISRAANHLMRMTLEGRLILSLKPPGYKKEHFAEHPDIAVIKELLALDHNAAEDESQSDEEESEVEDEQPIQVAKNKFDALEVSD